MHDDACTQGYLNRWISNIYAMSVSFYSGESNDFLGAFQVVILVQCVWKSGQTTFYKYRQRLQAICFLDLKKTSKEALFAQAVH